jgi:hypothetical protein
MGVTPGELAAYYPCLYHMAQPDSWESIRRHGLLSTSSLLTLFGIEGEKRHVLEECRRGDLHEIKDEAQGSAVLRDQKPIIESKLRAALKGCSLPDWYKLLNAKVFFWLRTERLNTLLSARHYRGKPHTVLTLETLPLTQDYEALITLSPMNSGNTLPIAHARGPETFKKMKDYPFAEREKYGAYFRVVELAVEGGIPDISKYVVRVETMVSDGATVATTNVIYTR